MRSSRRAGTGASAAPEQRASPARQPTLAAASDTRRTRPPRYLRVAILGSERPAYPGVGHEPTRPARRHAQAIARAAGELRKLVPSPGSYVSESDYFEAEWQNAFWGANYARLLAVKDKYDAEGLFFVHHGVGSERWSEDGFTRSRPS
jgi:hypothetical protein